MDFSLLHGCQINVFSDAGLHISCFIIAVACVLCSITGFSIWLNLKTRLVLQKAVATARGESVSE